MVSPAETLYRVVESARAIAGGPEDGRMVTGGETARTLATPTPPPVSNPTAVVDKDTLPAGARHVQTNVAAAPEVNAEGSDGTGPDTYDPLPLIRGATPARSRLITVAAPVFVMVTETKKALQAPGAAGVTAMAAAKP